MGMLRKLGSALFTVPLVLSSLLLRALQAFEKSNGKRRRSLIAARRSPTAEPPPRPREERAATPHVPGADVKAMRIALTAVLDEHPGSRAVFRYLAHFERRLTKTGLAALDLMPDKRLRRALAQFEAIVTNWSHPRLAELRSRMAVAISVRTSAGALWIPQATISKAYAPRRMPMLARVRAHEAPTPTEFQGSRQVEVEDDVSISRFEAAVGAWDLSSRQALAALSAPASRQ